MGRWNCFCCQPAGGKGRRRKASDGSFISAVSGGGVEDSPSGSRWFSPFIPTSIDILRHPSGEWWSDARLDAPHVVADLGEEPRLLARTLGVEVLDREAKAVNELGYFSEGKLKLVKSRRYVVVQLLMGAKIVTSIAEAMDVDCFDTLFGQSGTTAATDETASASSGSSCEGLSKRLKLIVNPANVTIPWSITGPRDSSSIADFFGEPNCSMKRKSAAGIEFAVVTIDVYSKFMIRSFLPKLAFQPGRISDYLIVDYEKRMIVTGFRLVCTSTLTGLLKKSPPKSPKVSPPTQNA